MDGKIGGVRSLKLSFVSVKKEKGRMKEYPALLQKASLQQHKAVKLERRQSSVLVMRLFHIRVGALGRTGLAWTKVSLRVAQDISAPL